MKALEKIPKDKLLHFGAGLIIALVIGLASKTPLYGLIAGVVAGIGKEVYDWQDYGKFDPIDMIATWIGAGIGFGIDLLVVKFIP